MAETDETHPIDGGPPPLEPATVRFRRQVGPEAADRNDVRLASALGAFAAALGGVGVAGLGVEVIDGGAPRVVAALIALVYGVTGFAFVARGHRSQRSAGVVAVAISVFAVYAFLIFSSDFDRTDPMTVLALSSITWGALHVVGPTRGHPLLLAAALVGIWAAVVVQIGLDSIFGRVDTAFSGFGPMAGPDSTNVAVVSLLFGVGYVTAAYGLHRSGLRGTATVFMGSGIVALALGVLNATAGREAWLAGIVLLSSGAFVGTIGALLRRRLSTWLGAAVAVVGIAAIIDAGVPDDQMSLESLLVVVVALTLIVGIPLLSDGLGEDGSGGDGGGSSGGSSGGAPPPSDPEPAPPETTDPEPSPARDRRRQQRPLRAPEPRD